MRNAAVDDALKHLAHPLPRHAETIRPRIVGRLSCPRAIVNIVFTSRLEWLFRHFSGMQAFGTVYHQKCQNVLGFLLTLPVVNVQCRFSERRKSVSPEFLDRLAKPSCLASLNGYFLRPPLVPLRCFP
jgi:hypothetical protein